MFLFKHEIEPLNLLILRPELMVNHVGDIISGMNFLEATNKFCMVIRVIQIVHRHLHVVLMCAMVGFVIIVSKYDTQWKDHVINSIRINRLSSHWAKRWVDQ